jgi:aminoglycoside phosphotransferase family enzyme/predicted kinase
LDTCPSEPGLTDLKQLREEDMLPQRLRAHAVTSEDLTRLAGRLAAFHRSAPANDAIRAYGTRAAVADTIAVTLQTMDSVAREEQSAPIRQVLRDYLEGFPEAHADLFARRVEENRIRDCHGDLRTQNICLDARYDDGIQVFDCIEFNDAFRYIDVAADIAYLAMDLDLAGRADLSAALMDAYTRETEDRSLAEILPFYLVYRAVGRGNIALLTARESEIPEIERQEQRDIAAAAYDLARSYSQRRPQPALFITVGFSGVGKSVLADALVRRLPAVHLSSDCMRKVRASVPPEKRLGSGQYTAFRRAEIYRALRERAEGYLAQGRHVLLDATFLDPQERESAACLARAHNAEFWILECRAPDALIRQRLQARWTDPHASDADLLVYEQQRFDYCKAGPFLLPASTPSHHVCVDTSRPTAEAAHDIVERFAAQSAI